MRSLGACANENGAIIATNMIVLMTTAKDLISLSLAAPSQPIDFRGEFFDAVLLDRQRLDDLLFARRDPGFIAADSLRQENHRLIAELERLLHDGRVNRSLFDAGQGLVFFIEGDDLHFADFAGLSDRAQYGGTVIRPEADHPGDVRIIDQRGGDIIFGAHAVGVVGADVNDIDVRALERFLQSAETLLSVLGVEHSDEDHDLAPLRQRLFDQLARLDTRGFVISAYIAGAIAIRRVAVLSDDHRLIGRAVDQLYLVLGVDGTDSYPVDAFRQQVVNHTLLPGGGAVVIDPELDLDVGQFRLSLLGTFARDRPEIRGVVGDEREPRLFGPARPVARSVRQNHQ